MSIKGFLANTALNISKHSSEILTALSIIGVGTTVYTAHQDTIKAEHVLDDVRYEYRKKGIYHKFTLEEKARLTWKCYIPTAISAVSTAGCIAGSHYCSHKQKEAISSAYTLSQMTLQEYQKKVIEKIGEKKERDIREEAYNEVAKRQAPMCMDINSNDVIDTGHGNTLIYDVVADRYIKSDVGYIQAVRNSLNHDLLSEMYFDWNEIRYRIGLPKAKYGDDRIVTIESPWDPHFAYDNEYLNETGQVRVNMTYNLIPKSEYEAKFR